MELLIRPAEVRQSMLGRDEPEYHHRDRDFGTQVATVTAVYPVGHPQNRAGQTLVDLLPNGARAPWRKVPLGAPYAHGETEVAAANTRRRQPYAPKPRNQMEGAVYDVRPGTRVLVAFPSGDQRAPVILMALKFNAQGTHAAPVERQGYDRFGGDGHFERVDGSPVDSGMDEFPRSVDGFNGARIVRDNAGSIALQSSTDHEPVFPGHNGIPAAPKPRGDITASTRGARVGRQGRLTGKDSVTGDAGDGTIRDQTIGATLGNLIVRLMSDVGRYYASTRGSGDGRWYAEDPERSYFALRANGNAEVGGAEKAVLDANDVCLGNDDPGYHAVLDEPITAFIDAWTKVFDQHKHRDVTSGSDTSGVPVDGIRILFETEYQLGYAWHSDHVRLVKTEAAKRHTEDDPDGEG